MGFFLWSECNIHVLDSSCISARHAAKEIRLHRQYVIGRLQRERRAQSMRLWHNQGGRHWADQGGRGRFRLAGPTLPCNLPRYGRVALSTRPICRSEERGGGTESVS